MAARDLEDLEAAHEDVPGEEDRPHAALPEFTQNFIIGVVDQSRRQAAGRGRRRCWPRIEQGKTVGRGDGGARGVWLGIGSDRG